MKQDDLISPIEAAQQAERDAIREWLDAFPDKSLRWFAERWGTTPSTVMRKINRHGFERVKSWHTN